MTHVFVYPMPADTRPVTRHKVRFLIHVNKMRRNAWWN